MNYIELGEFDLKNILIVDDDIHVGNMLEETLVREGYGVGRAYSGTEAVLVLSKNRPDLVLLDLMLPGLNGEDVLPHIKGIPVIVVSAKAEIDNKVDLLLGGAADYVTKPFETKELLARIAVQLRRSSVFRDSSVISDILKCGDLILNENTHEVSVGKVPDSIGEVSDDMTDGRVLVRLTRTEQAILKLLMQNPNQVVTKSLILDRISMDTPDCTESSLKMHVSNLRRKLREASRKSCHSEKDYIESVWGIGFKMRADLKK